MSESADERADLRQDGLVLSLDDFEQLRQEICASGPASYGGDLDGMEIDFDASSMMTRTPMKSPACGRTWLFNAIQAPNG